MTSLLDPARPRRTGRLAIDFAFTGGEGPELARFEQFHCPADLAAWLGASQLAVPGLRATPADLAAARRLRWAIANATQAVATGGDPAAEDASVIQAAAAHPSLVPHLGGGWYGATAQAALSDVARDAIALLSRPEQRARLRVCAAPDCPIPFYDDSRPGRRRWCEPNGCGDRNRQRALRARRAQEERR